MGPIPIRLSPLVARAPVLIIDTTKTAIARMILILFITTSQRVFFYEPCFLVEIFKGT
jgi:hypothetical protein